MKKLKKITRLNSVSLIIPLYNEELRLDYCFNVIKKFSRKKGKLSLEIVFVNDGSTDTSKKKILNFINKNKKKFFRTKIKLISYKKNMGKGYAVKKGLLFSSCEWIITCDVDMSVLPDQFLIWVKKKLIKNKKHAYFGTREDKKSVVEALLIRRIIGLILHIIILFISAIKISG